MGHVKSRFLQADFAIAGVIVACAGLVAAWLTRHGVKPVYSLLGFGAFLWLVLDVLTRRLSKESSVRWPALPDDPIVRDRAAARSDVDEGRAVFVMQEISGKPGTPIALELPQYAMVDSTAVAVVQAETDGVSTYVGFLDLESGTLDFAALEDVKLLGRTPPKSENQHGNPR